jgi:hypothetical protein
MKTILIWLFAGAIILAGVALYRSHTSRSHLNVEPHAAEVIEKAKRR